MSDTPRTDEAWSVGNVEAYETGCTIERELAATITALSVVTEDRDRLAQYHGGHMPTCRGVDDANGRCDCGYLQGDAYRDMVMTIDELNRVVERLAAALDTANKERDEARAELREEREDRRTDQETARAYRDEAEKARAERDRLRDAMAFIRDHGGTHTDEGFSTTGSWCAEQARSALIEADAAKGGGA